MGAACCQGHVPERGETSKEVLRIRKTATTIAMVVALFLAAATTARAVPRIPSKCTDALAPRLCAIHWHHKRANVYRAKLGLSRLPYYWAAEKHPARRDYFVLRWTRIHAHWKHVYRTRPRNPWSSSWYSAALCVHSKEGAWNDPNAPYYGGMQFSESSWLSNGGARYASRPDLATPHEQLLVAYHYWLAAGWHPWPNTAAACGLL